MKYSAARFLLEALYFACFYGHNRVLFMALVLLLCGQTAPDVAFGLIVVQNGLDLSGQTGIYLQKTLRDILVHRGF